MTSTTSDYEYVLDQITLTKEEQYPKSDPLLGKTRALCHWAMMNVLSSFDVEHADLQDSTRIGGKDDCGVDGWYFDPEEDIKTLYLFQSKVVENEGTILTEAEVKEIHDAISNLVNPDRTKNDEAANLAFDLKQWILDGDLSVEMYLVSSGEISEGSAAEAKLKEYKLEHDLNVKINGKLHSIPFDYHYFGNSELRQRHTELLQSDDDVISVETIRIINHNSDGPAFFEYAFGDEPTIFCLTYANDIAKVFYGAEKKWALFDENPRGPLQRKNNSIWTSLGKTFERSRFHAMNNGLSVVCDDYRLVPEGNPTHLEIVGMKIVNGCQTTITLGEALKPTKGDPRLDETVMLPMKVTKTQDGNYRENIARATNTQKQVTDADMASLKQPMQTYQDLFKDFQPPYFFEIKSGSWEYMMTKDDKSVYEGRRVQRGALAQAVMSANNRPGEALEDKKLIFVSEKINSKGRFEEIFGSHIRPSTMILSWAILEKLRSLTDQHLQQYKADVEKSKSPTHTHRPEVIRYSETHRAWLVCKAVSDHLVLKSFVDPSDGISDLQAKLLLANMDTWLYKVYEPVNEAVSQGIAMLRLKYPDTETRNFFRTSHSQVKSNPPNAGDLVPNVVFLEQLSVCLDRSATKEEIANALSTALTPSI